MTLEGILDSVMVFYTKLHWYNILSRNYVCIYIAIKTTFE